MQTQESRQLPLAGLKVIELGQLIAGPFATKLLGEFGADVIKIEPPGTGDPLRKWRMLEDDTSLWWHVQTRNKRSVSLDLRTSEGQDLVRQLATEADVLVENFRPGTLKQWGLNYEALSATGLARIEATSFVSPKAIPHLRDAAEVVAGIQRRQGVDITVLVPNIKGGERALACGVDEINLVMSASDSHGLANLRMTPEQSLAQFAEILAVVRSHPQGSGVFVNASLSTSFGCPFEGEVPQARVLELVGRLLELGIQGISLCDTTGMANPAQVARLCEAALARFPDTPFTLHFHNTRGMGLANVLAAWQAGIIRFDASLGGLGGCPFAPGATGNACTEDLVHMFEQMGVPTGVDLDALLAASALLPEMVGHDTPGQVVKAGKADRRYPMPAR